ncbi:hypothetical protein [Trinickia fusca]|uniref:DUF4376 domain-containing protein n=1 Tax=Trinickia fusca TaxID=2419777 RepID=A0A494XSI7_9BURK|nr:hypothetical protein [Trinickia fusca]RKP50503.1 hypothetical protein D7S89_05200 [Trinickia fusca]
MGKKLAVYDINGNITAFYDNIDSPIPASVTNVIEITQAQWQTCVSEPGQWYVASGALAQVPPPTAAQLLATAQSTQTVELTQACANAIISGFTSNALGSAYIYPSTVTDQANQNTVADCPSGGLLWCESNGAWAFRQHTQAQAQAVVTSFASWLNHCQSQLIALTTKVNTATSVDAVEAIAWVNP